MRFNALIVILAFHSTIIPMDPPVTTPSPMHAHFAQANAEAYYNSILQQQPSRFSQAFDTIAINTSTQVLGALIMLSITGTIHYAFYLFKGPTDEQRQIAIMLAKNENANKQNALTLKKEEIKVEREENQGMISSIKDLFSLPDEIVSPEEKRQAKQEFLQTYVQRLRKKQEQLPKLAQEDLMAAFPG